MTKKRWLIVAVAVAALGGVALFLANRPKKERWREVLVEQERFLLTVSQTGTIQPENKVTVISPIAGRIEQILVQEGDRVRRGQVIAWMSSTDRAALLDSARSLGEQEMRDWADQYKPTPIVSPSKGRIISRNVVVGQTVSQQTGLFDLSDRLIVMADVDETDLGKIRVGQEASVKVDSFPDKPIRARVSRIAHQSVVKNSINVYPVQLEPEALPEELRAGLTASVYFTQQDLESALTLPTWVAEGRESFTATIRVKTPGSEGDRGEEREVRFGPSNGQKVLVLGGLAAGDTVLVREQRLLTESGRGGAPFGVNMGGRRGAPRGR